jgi:thiol-disulfide isomerase/thioredoxin
MNIAQFKQHLANNPGIFLLKFTASWCGPCKQIEPSVMEIFGKLPPTFQCANIDIDECAEIYSFFKSKRMVNGVPVILCYVKNNQHYVPDDIVTGSNLAQLTSFFERCVAASKNAV